MLREALIELGRADLIGNGKRHLIPSFQPRGTLDKKEAEKKHRSKPFVTKYTGEHKAKKKTSKKKRVFKKQKVKKSK